MPVAWPKVRVRMCVCVFVNVCSICLGWPREWAIYKAERAQYDDVWGMMIVHDASTPHIVKASRHRTDETSCDCLWSVAWSLSSRTSRRSLLLWSGGLERYTTRTLLQNNNNSNKNPATYRVRKTNTHAHTPHTIRQAPVQFSRFIARALNISHTIKKWDLLKNIYCIVSPLK